MSLTHSIDFNGVQNVSIHRSSSCQKTNKSTTLLKCESKQPVPNWSQCCDSISKLSNHHDLTAVNLCDVINGVVFLQCVAVRYASHTGYVITIYLIGSRVGTELSKFCCVTLQLAPPFSLLPQHIYVYSPLQSSAFVSIFLANGPSKTCVCEQQCHIRCKSCPSCGLSFQVLGRKQPTRV